MAHPGSGLAGKAGEDLQVLFVERAAGKLSVQMDAPEAAIFVQKRHTHGAADLAEHDRVAAGEARIGHRITGEHGLLLLANLAENGLADAHIIEIGRASCRERASPAPDAAARTSKEQPILA